MLTLRELLVSRVAVLPGATRRVIRAAAVLGRPAHPDLITQTVGSPMDLVEEALRTAIERGVMEVNRQDGIGFTHPALQEVVYAQLMPGERSRLHRAAAMVLEGGHNGGGAAPRIRGIHYQNSMSELTTAEAGERACESLSESIEPLSEVAHHWKQAGDLSRAVDAALHAAQVAERRHAFADAHSNFILAAGLIDRITHTADRVDVLAGAARAASLLGDHKGAIRLTREALDSASDPLSYASLLERLGLLQHLVGKDEEAAQALREALALIPCDERTTLAARVRSGLALVAVSGSRLDEADREGRNALQVSRILGARTEEGQALHALGVVALAQGRFEDSVEHLNASLSAAQDVGDVPGVHSAYTTLSRALRLAGRLEDQELVCREGLRVFDRIGLERLGSPVLLAGAVRALVELGRYAEAEQLLNDVPARPDERARPGPVLIASASLAMALGDLRAAKEMCEQARQDLANHPEYAYWRRPLTETAAEVHLGRGSPDRHTSW